MVDRIACFLTCGYTEAGAMQFFLRKINEKYEYKQYLPNKTIKKKGDIKTINSKSSGLTGEALLEKIYTIISKHSAEINQCKAILIEDDLDGKFFNWSDVAIKEYTQRIIIRIQNILNRKIPVFVMYASPEIEGWFIADWKNGFENLYANSDIVNDVDRNVRLFFIHHLKKYINNRILKEYVDCIEEYGWFEGKYYKLSDQVIAAIQTEVKEELQKSPNMNPYYIKQIINSRKLYYSKKLHGDRMLRNIEPNIVASNCKRYFGDTYYKIRDFNY